MSTARKFFCPKITITAHRYDSFLKVVKYTKRICLGSEFRKKTPSFSISWKPRGVSLNHWYQPGQVLIGGYENGRLSSVELFPQPASETCSIPNLPEIKAGHSASLLPNGTLVVCGGAKDGSTHLDSCFSWSPGEKSWTASFKMR